jgi:Sulfatase
MADDIGWFDVSAYNRGIMGAPTPNIDRIAREGVLLTDAYGQASCTAGRVLYAQVRAGEVALDVAGRCAYILSILIGSAREQDFERRMAEIEQQITTAIKNGRRPNGHELELRY